MRASQMLMTSLQKGNPVDENRTENFLLICA
jgi:hypothetical protein